jgi:hypothetical protein
MRGIVGGWTLVTANATEMDCQGPQCLTQASGFL